MLRRRTARIFTAATLLLLLLFVPQPAAAVEVHDYINWLLALLQRGIQIYNQYEQISNQVQQIRNQVEQIRNLKRQLESFGEDGDWGTLQAVILQVEDLLRHGEGLTYLNDSIGTLMEETYPGFEAAEDYYGTYQHRLDRTRETFRLINRALNVLGREAADDSWLLALQQRSATADSPLEELEVIGMLQNHTLVEVQRTGQTHLLLANAIAVASAAAQQERATAEATRYRWLQQQDLPPVGYDPSPEGFSAVPPAWPWSF